MTERQSNVICVVFHESRSYNNKQYHYFCKYPVKVGDHVVVDSPYNGYTCVEVVEIKPKGSIKATKYVVQVVDDTEYLGDKARQKRSDEIKAQLKKRSEQMAEMEFYRRLAVMDPGAAELVKELEELQG